MPDTAKEFVLTITGMDCASCARSIEQGVAQLDGVQACELNFTTERLRVQGAIAQTAVIERIRNLGYDIVEPAKHAPQEQAAATPIPNFVAFLWQRPETRLALFGVLLILPGLIFHELFQWQAWWIDLFALSALLVAGMPIARSAWKALTINRELNINVLMTIAAAGAVIIGAYTEAGMVMVLFAIGEALEGYTSTRARHAIRSLMEVAPNTATRIERHGDHSQETRVPVESLAIGDTIMAKPGERIAMDGVIRAGVSSVNQAPITGESRLIEKEPGMAVFAGSVNGEGSLEIEITHHASDTTISRMIRLVEEAQERRAPVQRSVDQFAKYYTPGVVALAILVALIPPLVFGQPFWNPTPEVHGWLYRALALLVVACPCALVISTPVSMISALSAAARHGVLIKGGAYLEALSRIQAVAFDKTGTLTSGKPTVVAIRAATCVEPIQTTRGNCEACNDVLALAYAVERRSEHPVAHAISTASTERGLEQRYPAAQEVTALVGRGVNGRVNGQAILIGSHRHFDAAIPHSPIHCASALQEASQGYTPVLVSTDGTYLGTITVADTVRETSREAVRQLKSLGLKAIVMLTGDTQQTAERIAADVGVTDVQAELLPEHKVAAVTALQQRYGPIAMVGDGINDTPALATASVGIAIGGAHGGSNQAMETADVTLMSADLRQLPLAIRLSRAAMRTVSTNIAFSIGIKLVFLVLVLLGTGTLWMAVLADVGASLLVTLNGMRLLGYGGSSRHLSGMSNKG